MAHEVIDTFNDNLAQEEFEPVKTQVPNYWFLSCSDSRVVISHLLWADTFNEAFLVKNAGNISETNMGSIHYVIKHLKPELFIVLGHTTCGACNYAFQTKTEAGEKYLDKDLKELKILATTCETAEELEILNVKSQLKKLKEAFPEFDDKIVGALYNLEEKTVKEVTL